MTSFRGLRAERRRVLPLVLAAAGVLYTPSTASLAAQDSSQTAVPSTSEKKLAAGEKEAKKMLLLMDKDQNGKVSKQEFMSFMEAEFDRLDVNKDGELDVKELTQSHVQIRTRGR
jgi:hypothetical protein